MGGSGAGTRSSLRPMTHEQGLVVERMCAALGVEEGMATLRQALALADLTQLPAERTALITFVHEHVRAALQGEASAMLDALLADLADFHAPDAMLRREAPLPTTAKNDPQKNDPPAVRRGGPMRVLVVRRDALTRAHMSQSLLSSGFDVESVVAEDLSCLVEPISVFHAIIVDLEALVDLVPVLPRDAGAPTVMVRTRGSLSEAKTIASGLGFDDVHILSETAPISMLIAKLRDAMAARGLRAR